MGEFLSGQAKPLWPSIVPDECKWRRVPSATMAAVETKEQPVSEKNGLWSRYVEISRNVRRGFIAEWTVTIILLLFATTTLVQAFVIPSASMVGTLLIGDHVLVDKLVYAPGGAISSKILPYRDVRRGDIIV